MTTENRRTSFKPHAFLAAFGLALAFFASPANAGTIPLLSSATLTTGADDQSLAVARDGTGNLYAVGYSSAGTQGKNIWVSRWNEASLTVISSMTFNGTGNGPDYAEGVTLDDSGNVYVTGVSSVTGAGLRMWLGKFTNSLVFVSSITYPIPIVVNALMPVGIVAAPGGNLFTVNSSTGTGAGKITLAQFTPALGFVSSTTFFNGFDANLGFALVRDSGGNLYVGGGVAPASLTSSDAWIGKFNSSLVFVASATRVGPAGNTDQIRGITIGSDSNIYVTGTLNNTGVIVDAWLAKYSPGLALLSQVSLPNANGGNNIGNFIVAGSTRLYVAGSQFVIGQSDNAWLGEFDYSFNQLSSAAFNTGAGSDMLFGLAVDTTSGKAYVAGTVTPSVPQIWVGQYQLSGYASYPGCAVTNDVGAGQPFTTIQAAVNALPTTLTGPSCVVIRDGATYAEQVTVQGFVNNGSSITIMADPGSGLRPIVAPAGGFAAFNIVNASVNIAGIRVSPTAGTTYGIYVSSPYVTISSVGVIDTAFISGAGIAASSWTTISYTSVTVSNAKGIFLPGSVMATVSYSTMTNSNASMPALYLLGASSSTITGVLATNGGLGGNAIRIKNGGYNSVSLSSFTAQNTTAVAFYLDASSFNAVTQSYMSGSDYGSYLNFSFANAISFSTMTGSVLAGLYGVGSDSNTVTQSYMWGDQRGALLDTGSDRNAISLSSVIGNQFYGLHAVASDSNTVTQSYMWGGGYGAYLITGADYNAISLSTMIGNTDAGFYAAGSDVNTVTQSYLWGGARGALLDVGADFNTISLSTMIGNSLWGLYVLKGSTNTIQNSYVQGSTAVYVTGSTGTVISDSVLVATNTVGRALQMDGGSVGLKLSNSSLSAPSLGFGLQLEGGNSGMLVFSTNTIKGARYGMSVGPQAVGASLVVTSMTFTNLTAGATAVNFVGGGTVVSTFAAMGFGAPLNVNVNATALGGGSRITMFGAVGSRGGPAFENDPSGFVDWPGYGGGGVISSAPYSAVTDVALTANWSSSFAGGTNYAVELSTGGFPNNFSGNQSQNTATLSQIFSGLTAATQYFARVSTNGATGPYTLLGTTVTTGGGAGTITPFAYTGVSANSLTANWGTTFTGGTVYYLRLSTDSFSTYNYTSTTTNANFFFGGLQPATTYEVRVSTVIGGIPFTGLGISSTPSTGGGALNFNFTNTSDGAVIASANGQNEMGLNVIVDTFTGGGPYAYVIYASTPGATGSRSFQHDTAGVVGLARYGQSGTVLSSRTLAIDSKGAMAGDSAGNIFVAETDLSLGSGSKWFSKYGPNLNQLGSLVVADANIEFGPMISTGTSIFALLEDPVAGNIQIVNYSPSLVAVATTTPFSLASGAHRGHGMARDKFSGNLYVLVSSGNPNAEVHLLKYNAFDPLAFNTATPIQNLAISDVATKQYPRVAVAAGKVYVAFTDIAGTNIFVREYSQSFVYTGFSSTITNVTAPFGKPSLAIQSDGQSIYVGATVNTGGNGDYLVMKYDANNGLAFLSSATFNSPTYLSDQLGGMALGLPGEVYVTGGSSNTISNADVVSTKFMMGVGAGVAGAVSSAPYTNVSTSSFIANWNTNFVNGTVYYVQLSTNAFASSNFNNTTTNASFVYNGLSPATTYEVRVGTVGFGGPFTPLGVVTTLSAGVSISGIVSYSGFEPGAIRIEAYPNAAYTGIPTSSQVLSNAPSQSFYLPVGAGTFYVRAYVDALGGGNYQTWLDQGTTGPFTLGASSFTGKNFSIAVDSIAPNSPLGLSASPSAGQVFLTWAVPTTSTNGAALQDLRGYIIRRSTGGPGVDLAGSPSAPISSASLNFTDFSPVPGVSNIYSVIAVDFARNQSAPSSPASISGSAGGSAGTITGHISTYTATTSGTFRVRLSSMSGGAFIAESNQSFYSFTGLSTGTYYLSGFRDLNEDGLQGGFEPAGVFGGMNNNPYPIYVSGTNSSFADVTLCDRTPLSLGTPANGTLQSNGCPARDAGPDRYTNLLAFEAGTGAAGSVALGTALTISMNQINGSYDSRLIVLGPNGQILADNSSPGGAAVSLTPNATGVYVVEPTAFNGFITGTYSVSMNAGASGAASDGINGTLSYTGSQTGNIGVRFFTNATFTGVPVATMSVTAASGTVSNLAFDKRYLPVGSYYVDAFRDTSGAGFNPAYQAYGKCNGGSQISVAGGASVFIGNCVLADPSAGGGTGSGLISGNLTYVGSPSGTVRLSLFSLASDYPVQTQSTAFASTMPYSFTGLNAGTYFIKAFADLNNNFVPDSGEQVMLSQSAGIGLTSGTSLSGQNFTMCDRSAIADGVAQTANLTASDCLSSDRTGAYMKMYTFSGTRGQTVSISAIAQGFYGTYLALYDHDGKLAAYNDGVTNGNAEIQSFALPSDGLYTIGVSPYAPGVTGQIEVSFLASNGAVGSIAGDVSYQGTQGGRIMVVLFDSPSFSSSSYIDQRILVSTRNFQFNNLFSGSSYYLGAFVDVNFNNNPDQGEDKAYFGDTAPSPIFLGAGQSMTGASIIIGVSTAAVAGASYLTGNVYYAGAQTGQLVLEFWPSSQFIGQPVAVRNIPSGIVSSSATYDVSLPGGVNYFVRAFLDVNGDFIPNPSEPKGVYSPNGQGASAIFVPAGQTLLNVDVTMRDPGQTTGGALAGVGTAVITNTSIAAGQPFSLTVVYTATGTGILIGGKVGMTVPPGFPFPYYIDSVTGSSITARSGASISSVTYSGPSVFVTLTSPLASGATVGFEWSNVYAPCTVGSATFTVTSVSTGSATAPLFAGSPSVPVVAGSASFFQLSTPYFSVKQGSLSDINYLEARDSCGSKVALASAKTVDLRGSSYNPALGQFAVDSDIGLTTGTAVSTASALAVDFAIGESSRPFYVVSASTGFKNLEVHYNLLFDTTFYFGVSALPGNALTGVFVSTSSGVTALSSATISLGAGGLTNQVFIGFTLGDPQQSWRVLFSSIPFKPGVPPTPVWERWGYGQPNPGEIAWDGRFNPWINGGVRVPNGLYYGRVEVGGGGGGVKDDTLRVAMSLPSFAGKIYDPAVTPNPPLSGVQLRVYGPSGYFTAVTGADGSYSMPGLGAGAYRLNLSLADYVDAVVDMTLNAAGDATSFTARTAGLAVSSNSTGGLDAFLGRAPRLIVVPSLDPSISAVTFDQWGSLQVRSSTGVNSNTTYGPMRLAANTTTFDDGGQWDPSTQQFVSKTLLAFNVPVGTYSVVADLSGYSRSTGTVYVGASGARLDLSAFTQKTVVTGQVSVLSNPYGMNISVVAVPLTTSSVESGFAFVNLPPLTLSAGYTMGGLDAGSYMLRANAQGLSAVSLGPVTLPASGVLAGQNFPAFGAGASIFGTITVGGSPTIAAGTPLYLNAWAPGSFNFGSTVVYTNGGGAAAYSMPGLDANATYQLYVNIQNNGGNNSQYDVPGGFPMLVQPSAGALNFTMSPASGVVMGTIYLQAGASDFLNVELYGRTLASLRPADVGRTFVEISTTLPGFSCAGLPASNISSVPVAGYCPLNASSATFMVTGANTETLEISFLHKTSGQSSKQILSIVNGATSTFVADLSSQTFSIAGSILNQITTALFNTNSKIVDNAPLIAPNGYPADISSTTARVTAIRQDIDAFGVAISTVFNPLTSRVGFIVGSGTFTIANVPKGVYFVRTTELRSCTTCPVLVPSVGKVVSVAGASVSSVTLTLSDGYSVSGSISLDGAVLDARIFDVTVVNRRQEVVSSTVVYLGDINQGVTANTVDYTFTNLPAGEFYTLTVRGQLFPIKYAGRPIKFPDASLSPNGLQSSLTGQNVLMQRAAYIVGRLKDGGTGELIRAANATLLAPNFAIKAIANPWIEGGYVTAASSISARPIEGDGYFRVGPLVPDVSYDLRLAQATWDPNFMASGSQNYSPVTISGLKPTPGEIRDVGVVALGQGQSITGVVRSTTTGLTLGNIKVTARPSFGTESDLLVQTFTNSQGAYSLWVSTAISNQFTLVAAPRDGNQASDGRYYGTVELTNVNLQTQTTAFFVLTPLPVVVTGQIVVADAATGGALSFPFGEKRGYPAAAVNLQPVGVVPENPLGDIETDTDERGFFTIPGLSTGLYHLHATSLGYAVYNATVQVVGASFSIFTGSNTPTGGVLTLARGATATGRILKSDGTSPNSSEVVGVAAANFGAGEFVVGSVETDPVAKTVNAYTISGFKPGISYSLVLLSGSNGKEVSFPPEGAGVVFSASESTATKSINLTYRPATLDCLGTAKALDAARSQFLVQIDCLKPLRQANAADDDLTTILTVSTYTAARAALVAPNGTGVLNNPSNSTSRRLLTATYTPAALETRFSIRIRASAAEIDPNTGDNFAIDKVFDFYAGLESSADGRASNINGGKVGMKPSAQDELLGLDERSGIDLPPGAFAEGSDSLSDASVVANPTTTVNVSMTKGRNQALAKALSIATLGYAPAALSVADVPSAFPAEMWAAMNLYRTQASTTQVGGANPLSAFYSIFLPAGIRHQLKSRADLTLSYSLAASTSTADDKIQVWFYNAALGRFVAETTNRRLDTVNKTVTVSVDHFSTFVVLDSPPTLISDVNFGGVDIAVANFPNPADCITHSNIARNSTLFGLGGVHDPFVGTMIRTSVPPGDNAELKFNIYTVAGEKIRTISNGMQTAGKTYYSPWNCKNDGGGTVASGVYIGEAVFGGRRKFFKIAIIKGSGL